jgi:hypothetical protein
MKGGKDDEVLSKFATLFQNRGVPNKESTISEGIAELRMQEGLVSSS